MKPFLETNLTFSQYLEARRNPELNPKISAYEALLPYKDDPDVYISFTDIDKIGINPRSKYNTPLGIYTYPLREVWDTYKFDQTKSPGQSVPFAGEAPFIWILRKKKGIGFIEDLYTTYTSKDYDMDIKKLQSFVLKEKIYSESQYYFTIEKSDDRLDMKSAIVDFLVSGKQLQVDDLVSVMFKYFDIPEFKEEYRDRKAFKEALIEVLKEDGLEVKDLTDPYMLDSVIFKLDEGSLVSIENLADNAIGEARHKSPSGIMWNLTRMLAGIYARQIRSKLPIQWNVIFRKALGYEGVADKSGRGIIHPSEPMQAVFFSTKGFDVVNKVLNKDYRKDGSQSVYPDWLQDAIFKDENIVVKESKYVTWKYGTWMDGVWEDGRWENGTWKGGTWESGIWETGFWLGGTWENGVWKGGTWKNGKWLDGTWDNGLWVKGTWVNGIWERGDWLGGTWMKGDIFDPELNDFVKSTISPKEYFANKK